MVYSGFSVAMPLMTNPILMMVAPMRAARESISVDARARRARAVRRRGSAGASSGSVSTPRSVQLLDERHCVERHLAEPQGLERLSRLQVVRRARAARAGRPRPW